ncbi:hypothetical protein AB0M68_32585 [Streptomyces sp. NPDC051453]|uniref:hypothetical protein n=1 Tax=Streptomyces sp. NPDC051453 TaxID=3154941 RepID=UPI0034454A49
MGLTCLLLIANALIRDQGRRFDTIEDIDDVTGTPECKAQGHRPSSTSPTPMDS